MSETTQTCIRGCRTARRHVSDCDDEQCQGCAPRPATNGLLCYGCHSRLLNLLQNAHGQWALLLATAGKSVEQVLTAETTARPNKNPRLSSSAPFPGVYAKGSTLSMSQSEPVRIAALSAADELADHLSQIVEQVVEAHDLAGPKRLHTGEADDRRWVWKPVRPDGTPAVDFNPVVTHHDPLTKETVAGQYVLVEPPAKFAVGTGSAFLLAWLDRLESLESVGDDLGTLSEVMSQAHSLAPWREQVARLKGIPCPECHACALARFGGDEDVTCLKCKATMGPGRYLIWTKMLADEHQESA